VKADEELNAEHRRVWHAKPNLRASYGRYHDMLLAQCPKDAVTVELGCGLGHLTEKARARGHDRWIATDIMSVGSARLRCDGTALPFASGSVDRIVFIDVMHHMSLPKAFFREAARVLKPGGKVVAVEPWVTPLSYFLYRFFHVEGCDLSRDVDAPFSSSNGKAAYEGDAGLTSLVCWKTCPDEWERLGFGRPAIEPFNDFAYVSTRGFRPGPDVPTAIFRTARLVLDDLLSPVAPLLGMRALIRWDRAGPPR
jgi:SAM-dependent methyltransferase